MTVSKTSSKRRGRESSEQIQTNSAISQHKKMTESKTSSKRRRRESAEQMQTNTAISGLESQSVADLPTIETLLRRVDETLDADQSQAKGDTEVTDQPLAAIEGGLILGLSQALKSGDEALLEGCLAVTNQQVVADTVRALSAMQSVKLLELLVRKLERKPHRAVVLCPWFRHLFISHASSFIGIPALEEGLTATRQICAQRVAALPRMFNFMGRLELMSSQIVKETGAAQRRQSRDLTTQVYIDDPDKHD